MPPVVFVDKSTGLDDAGSRMTFTLPVTARAGDTLLAVIASDPTQTGPSNGDREVWDVLAELAVGSAKVYVLRRTVAEDEGIETSIDFNGAWLQGVLMVYRGLDDGAAALGSAISSIVASTNFVCPSETLVRYSDLYLGIVVVTSAVVLVTNPLSSTERHEELGANATLEVFEILPEAPGATGTKTATTAANRTGVAASIALASLPTVQSSLVAIALDPPGTIGLALEGV
jgi:hypothetical protein